MTSEYSEVRLDIPWAGEAGAQGFEKAWKCALDAQKMTGLTAPPMETVGVRFRVCGLEKTGEQMSALSCYLQSRLAALPGTPTVLTDTDGAGQDWQGVRIWLTCRSKPLADLLRRTRRASSYSNRGRRK